MSQEWCTDIMVHLTRCNFDYLSFQIFVIWLIIGISHPIKLRKLNLTLSVRIASMKWKFVRSSKPAQRKVGCELKASMIQSFWLQFYNSSLWELETFFKLPIYFSFFISRLLFTSEAYIKHFFPSLSNLASHVGSKMHFHIF